MPYRSAGSAARAAESYLARNREKNLARRQAILDYVQVYAAEYGTGPSVREIVERMQAFPADDPRHLQSKGSVHGHAQWLLDAGFLRRRYRTGHNADGSERDVQVYRSLHTTAAYEAGKISVAAAMDDEIADGVERALLHAGFSPPEHP